eukprot:SAG31_NODE_5847_length_2298_cov_1.515689_1_plen_356_part_00
MPSSLRRPQTLKWPAAWLAHVFCWHCSVRPACIFDNSTSHLIIRCCIGVYYRELGRQLHSGTGDKLQVVVSLVCTSVGATLGGVFSVRIPPANGRNTTSLQHPDGTREPLLTQGTAATGAETPTVPPSTENTNGSGQRDASSTNVFQAVVDVDPSGSPSELPAELRWDAEDSPPSCCFCCGDSPHETMWSWFSHWLWAKGAFQLLLPQAILVGLLLDDKALSIAFVLACSSINGVRAFSDGQTLSTSNSANIWLFFGWTSVAGLSVAVAWLAAAVGPINMHDPSAWGTVNAARAKDIVADVFVGLATGVLLPTATSQWLEMTLVDVERQPRALAVSKLITIVAFVLVLAIEAFSV